MRIVLVVAFAGAAAFAWNGGVLAPLLPGLAPGTCSVGLAGAAVSVTVEGAGAAAECESLARTTTGGGSWYVYAGGQEPQGAVICQVNVRGRLFTVRDQGLLNLYGTQICGNLATRAGDGLTAASSAPVASPGGSPSCGLQVHDHAAVLFVYGTGSAGCDYVATTVDPMGGLWDKLDVQKIVGNPAALLCAGSYNGFWVQVYDSGGQIYGTSICRKMGLRGP